jgi:hypothetical protein
MVNAVKNGHHSSAPCHRPLSRSFRTYTIPEETAESTPIEPLRRSDDDISSLSTNQKTIFKKPPNSILRSLKRDNNNLPLDTIHPNTSCRLRHTTTATSPSLKKNWKLCQLATESGNQPVNFLDAISRSSTTCLEKENRRLCDTFGSRTAMMTIMPPSIAPTTVVVPNRPPPPTTGDSAAVLTPAHIMDYTHGLPESPSSHQQRNILNLSIVSPSGVEVLSNILPGSVWITQNNSPAAIAMHSSESGDLRVCKPTPRRLFSSEYDHHSSAVMNSSIAYGSHMIDSVPYPS